MKVENLLLIAVEPYNVLLYIIRWYILGLHYLLLLQYMVTTENSVMQWV